MIPSINLNFETKYIFIAAIALCAIGTFICLGYMMGQGDPESVCRNYIERSKELSAQVQSLENEMSSERQAAITSCVNREQSLCDDKIEIITQRMRLLRCKICSGGDK